MPENGPLNFSEECWQNCPRVHAAIAKAVMEGTIDATYLTPDNQIPSQAHLKREFGDFWAPWDPHGAGDCNAEGDKYEWKLQFIENCAGPMLIERGVSLENERAGTRPTTYIKDMTCSRGFRQIGIRDNPNRKYLTREEIISNFSIVFGYEQLTDIAVCVYGLVEELDETESDCINFDPLIYLQDKFNIDEQYAKFLLHETAFMREHIDNLGWCDDSLKIRKMAEESYQALIPPSRNTHN